MQTKAWQIILFRSVFVFNLYNMPLSILFWSIGRYHHKVETCSKSTEPKQKFSDGRHHGKLVQVRWNWTSQSGVLSDTHVQSHLFHYFVWCINSQLVLSTNSSWCSVWTSDAWDLKYMAADNNAIHETTICVGANQKRAANRQNKKGIVHIFNNY